MNLTVTPNISLSSERIDIQKLNMWANPVVSIPSGSIDHDQISGTYFQPSIQSITAGNVNNWTPRTDLGVNIGAISGTTGNGETTTVSILSKVAGQHFVVMGHFTATSFFNIFNFTNKYSNNAFPMSFGTTGYYMIRFYARSTETVYAVNTSRFIP